MKIEGKAKKKTTIRVSRKDFMELLNENERMNQQITELQSRMTELVEENRKFKVTQSVGPPDPPIPTIKPEDMEKIRKELEKESKKALPRRHVIPRPDIYID